MDKKIHIIYISLIVITIGGFSFLISDIESNQDKKCWEMIKEIAKSKEI
jgi:preprotein translocase subunit YajC